jgi:hypothetical protein
VTRAGLERICARVGHDLCHASTRIPSTNSTRDGGSLAFFVVLLACWRARAQNDYSGTNDSIPTGFYLSVELVLQFYLGTMTTLCRLLGIIVESTDHDIDRAQLLRKYCASAFKSSIRRLGQLL